MTSSHDQPWPLWKLGLVLYPFAAAAVAINLFMLALIGPAFGLPNLAPVTTLLVAIPIGVPATWAAALWVRSLITAAER
jgi:hypothetical protein